MAPRKKIRPFLNFKKLLHRAPPGSPPGTITANPEALETTTTVLAYRGDEYVETEWKTVADLQKLQKNYAVVWLNINGLKNTALLDEIAGDCGIHPLAFEDVINVGQRAKVEVYDEDLFLVARLAELNDMLETRQVSFYMRDKLLVTFHEKPEEIFEQIRDRIRNGRGRIRRAGVDYLAYALLDGLVDGYFPVLEEMGERLAALEQQLIDTPDTETLQRIHQSKRQLIVLRRAVWPLRETLNKLMLPDYAQIKKETRLYLRDVWDHVFQVMDFIENFREIGSGLMDLHMSAVSNRMNEVMKVLTMIATVFIPLSFIAGIYGMNFDPKASPFNMPELGFYFGYPFVLLLMLGVAAAFVLYFKRKGWLRSETEKTSKDEPVPPKAH
jgi:magnesium transporter